MTHTYKDMDNLKTTYLWLRYKNTTDIEWEQIPISGDS